jgi:hypothetical protein
MVCSLRGFLLLSMVMKLLSHTEVRNGENLQVSNRSESLSALKRASTLLDWKR